MKHLDSAYFLGKVCLMVTNGTENTFDSSVKSEMQHEYIIIIHPFLAFIIAKRVF